MGKISTGVRKHFHNVESFYAHYGYLILFYSLLLTLIASPLLSTFGISMGYLRLFLGLNLIGCVLPVTNPLWRKLLICSLVLAGVLQIDVYWFHREDIQRLALAFWALVAIFTAGRAVHFCVRNDEIDGQQMYAALSAYLLIGIFLGISYWILEATWPGSFVFTFHLVDDGIKLADTMYFSFVTLSTLGYGDLVPRSPLARGMAIVEAIAGQLYLAVMVARMVTLYVGRPRKKT